MSTEDNKILPSSIEDDKKLDTLRMDIRRILHRASVTVRCHSICSKELSTALAKRGLSRFDISRDIRTLDFELRALITEKNNLRSDLKSLDVRFNAALLALYELDHIRRFFYRTPQGELHTFPPI